MAKAYYIQDWVSSYEVLKSGKPYGSGSGLELKSQPLPFVRVKTEGLGVTLNTLKLAREARKKKLDHLAVYGFYIKLLTITAGHKRGHRGWLISEGLDPITPDELADLTYCDVDKISYILIS